MSTNRHRHHGTSADEILEEIDDRLTAGGSRYLKDFKCSLNRAGVDIDEVVQSGRIAANRTIAGYNLDGRVITATERETIVRHAISIGMLKMKSFIVDFFRKADNERRSSPEVARYYGGTELRTPEDTLLYGQLVLSACSDPMTGKVSTVITNADGPATVANFARKLNMSESSVARLQAKMKKKFDDS